MVRLRSFPTLLADSTGEFAQFLTKRNIGRSQRVDFSIENDLDFDYNYKFRPLIVNLNTTKQTKVTYNCKQTIGT